MHPQTVSNVYMMHIYVFRCYLCSLLSEFGGGFCCTVHALHSFGAAHTPESVPQHARKTASKYIFMHDFRRYLCSILPLSLIEGFKRFRLHCAYVFFKAKHSTDTSRQSSLRMQPQKSPPLRMQFEFCMHAYTHTHTHTYIHTHTYAYTHTHTHGHTHGHTHTHTRTHTHTHGLTHGHTHTHTHTHINIHMGIHRDIHMGIHSIRIQ